MTPPPANLRDAARLDRLSLYAIYNTLGLGVEGTDMPSFADQLDDRQRWDLATYIAGFSADPAAAKSEQGFNLADLARQTPGEVLAAQDRRPPRPSVPSAPSHPRPSVARGNCWTTPPRPWTRAWRPTAAAITNRPTISRSPRTWKASSWWKAPGQRRCRRAQGHRKSPDGLPSVAAGWPAGGTGRAAPGGGQGQAQGVRRTTGRRQPELVLELHFRPVDPSA